MHKTINNYSNQIRLKLFGPNLIEEANAKQELRTILFFIFTIIFYVSYLILRQSPWVLSGEMWAEMATNYFFNSNSASFMVKFFSTDSGYIPLPQRIFAAIGNYFELSTSVIPYYYTWSAIITTALMVGTFCLSHFRTLVRNDYLRCFTSMAILLLSDFETRTFVNFTYFSIFFIAIINALALVQYEKEVPWWSWIIPIFMISKPSALCILPTMILTAFVSNPRFKKITLVSTILCLSQLLMMAYQHSGGLLKSSETFSFFEKINATFMYFISFLGAFFIGKTFSSIPHLPLISGIILFSFGIFILIKKPSKASSLILIGFSLLFFNMLLNAFALSQQWNLNLEKLYGIRIYRHNIVGLFGVIMVIVGIIENKSFFRIKNKDTTIYHLGPILFLTWLLISNWLKFIENMNRLPDSPLIYNSQWQSLAPIISSSNHICIPIDPFGWIFKKNCSLLNSDLNLGKRIDFKTLFPINGVFSFTVEPPESILNKKVLSLATLIKANSVIPTIINAEAILNFKNGTIKKIFGSRSLHPSGGLVMFQGSELIPITDIKNITFQFHSSKELSIAIHNLEERNAILWMGE